MTQTTNDLIADMLVVILRYHPTTQKHLQDKVSVASKAMKHLVCRDQDEETQVSMPLI